jgi:hypothetical protein
METNEWAARTFAYLFQQIDFLPDGTGKNRLAELLLQSPQSVKDEAAQYIIDMERTNAQDR